MDKIIIIADDLTGANANGSLLAAKGFTAATCLDKEQWNPAYFADYDAVSFNTDSRLVPSDVAWKRVYDGVRLLVGNTSPAVVAKRIDSTMRGNVGTEIEAALNGLDDCNPSASASIAVVVPAFPASSRLAVGGYLIVNGIPLEKSPIAKDPVRPVTTSQFVSIISEQTKLPTGYVSLNTIMQGIDATKDALYSLQESGVRIIACDAVTDDDIATVAKALKDAPFPVMAVDPGPFTAATADVRISVKERHELEDNILVIVGSTTDLVRRQMEELRLARRCAITRIDCRLLVNPATRDAAIAEVVNAVKAKVDKAEVYGVCTVERAEDVHSLEAMALENNVSLQEASERINTGLAGIAEILLQKKELRLGGLYTSGGEVTVAVARRLSASGFSVRGEVLPLAVYGRLIGGQYPDLPMVTKGGFVGDSESIVQCVNYLFTKISTQTRQSEDKE